MRHSKIFGSIALVLLSNAASAKIFNVNLTTDLPDVNPGDGICSVDAIVIPNTAVCSLRAAVMEANALAGADEIVLEGGKTYKLTIPDTGANNAASGDLDILSEVSILGNSITPPIIDANGEDRAIQVSLAKVDLTSIDITGGSRADCTGPAGNAIDVAYGNVTVNRLRVYNNGNDGCNLAAVTTTGGSISLSRTQIYDNDAGFTSSGSMVQIDYSGIYGNRGNGIRIADAGSFAVRRTTISGNGILGSSAGLMITGSPGEIQDVTVVNNDRYGIRISGNSVVRMRNSLFAANVQNCDVPDAVFGAGQFYSNFYDDAGCGVENSSLHNQTAFVGPLGFYGGATPVHRPLTTVSPVIDYDNDCTGTGNDQRGLTRVVGFKSNLAKCDIGSVELQNDEIYFDSLEWF